MTNIFTKDIQKQLNLEGQDSQAIFDPQDSCLQHNLGGKKHQLSIYWPSAFICVDNGWDLLGYKPNQNFVCCFSQDQKLNECQKMEDKSIGGGRSKIFPISISQAIGSFGILLVLVFI